MSNSIADNWSQMLDELLCDDSDALSEWEAAFVNSIDTQRNPKSSTGGFAASLPIRPFHPSGKQLVILRRIWNKVFLAEPGADQEVSAREGYPYKFDC